MVHMTGKIFVAAAPDLGNVNPKVSGVVANKNG